MMNDIISSTNITVKPVNESRINEVDFDNLIFGRKFSDHMFEMDYVDGEWKKPVVKPYGAFEVTPAMNVFHYGQAVFEGMKAFYVDENTVHIFRPETHFERFNNSCRRMCIPETDYETFIEALETLIKMDSQWIPKKSGTALYIRPFIFASDDLLAARSSDKFTYQIITSPVGAYYAEGFNPVSLTTTENYVRAVKGGTGEAKAAGNYAGSFLPAQKAKEKGYTQVLWLDAKEHKYIEEVGTMNIHFLIGDTLITPALTGSILPGVTRRSVVALAKEWGLNVEERRITIDEVFKAYEDGSLKEIFGSGTAAVVSPVGLIDHKGKTIELDREKPGEFAQKCFDKITDIQYGRAEDKFGWIHPVTI
ncbi:MAG: branched chain amino acid aminotransferase [Balneola sp.]|jgi:branched-chain amino acid aminotransferase|nr:branched chain amino acid aminotransferase [Balneola sp.]MBE78549.1 branched chain amino acid aminotransferase [Balneola sp.]HBX66278.1 branched chain amino acid aminotransferase [Balneolaceae bacterium]|tara:strand:- start:1557 stop:2648 length:1092 start_codon:yes stop_codon:yes gene_type:complete